MKQYVDATIAHAEKREKIAVPTSAVVEDVRYAITNARIENATGAMSHVVATILLVHHQGISKPYLVYQVNRLKLRLLRRQGRVTNSLACIGIRGMLGLWWSANDIEVSCKAVHAFLSVRKLREEWMRAT